LRNERIAASAVSEAAAAEMVWLLGQPHLSDYLDFVRDKVVGGGAVSQRQLTDEWRAANDHYYELEKEEAGEADKADCRPLPAELRPLARKVKADPYYREAFEALPSRIMMVELDRLIVSQTHVERSFTESLCAGLAPDADLASLFRFCLPLDRAPPPVRIQRLGSDRYLFASESTDFRVHPTALLRPHQLRGHASFGPVTAALAVVVGFGSNFLSAVRSGKRLVLHNGYHRAYALRAMGFTHAPCVVTTVTRKDELRVAAGHPVGDDPEFYFAAKRPPLLKDFFDPKLRKILAVTRMETVIEVELKVRSGTAAPA
jgi:hypothetical protein